MCRHRVGPGTRRLLDVIHPRTVVGETFPLLREAVEIHLHTGVGEIRHLAAEEGDDRILGQGLLHREGGGRGSTDAKIVLKVCAEGLVTLNTLFVLCCLFATDTFLWDPYAQHEPDKATHL